MTPGSGYCFIYVLQVLQDGDQIRWCRQLFEVAGSQHLSKVQLPEKCLHTIRVILSFGSPILRTRKRGRESVADGQSQRVLAVSAFTLVLFQ